MRGAGGERSEVDHVNYKSMMTACNNPAGGAKSGRYRLKLSCAKVLRAAKRHHSSQFPAFFGRKTHEEADSWTLPTNQAAPLPVSAHISF